MAHTNEYEYNSYFGNKENEAMIDRIFVVRVPYNLRLTEEIKIYEKLIGQSPASGRALRPDRRAYCSAHAPHGVHVRASDPVKAVQEVGAVLDDEAQAI